MKTKTLIFRNYKEFKEYIANIPVKNRIYKINGVTKEFALKYPNYKEDNETNDLCFNCFLCKNCFDSSESTACIDSKYIHNCTRIICSSNLKNSSWVMGCEYDKITYNIHEKVQIPNNHYFDLNGKKQYV